MKCVKCGVKYKTLRTLAQGDQVVRERECNCGRTNTVEMREGDLKEKERLWMEKVGDLRREIVGLEGQLGEVRRFFRLMERLRGSCDTGR